MWELGKDILAVIGGLTFVIIALGLYMVRRDEENGENPFE